MHFSKSISCLLALAALQPCGASTLGLESAVQTALANNRGLQAARFAAAEAQGRLSASGVWKNPEFEFSGMSDFAFGSQGAGAFTIGLHQEFPLTSRLSLAREAGRIDLLRALREIRNHERLLVLEVRHASIAVLAAQAREAALRELLEASKKSKALAQERLAAGQAALSEKSLALVQELRVANDLESARMDKDIALLGLKTLLGLGAAEPLRLSDSLAGALEKLAPLADSAPASVHRPDVDLLLLESEKAGVEAALARAEAWEGVRIGIEYTYDRNMDEPEGLGTDNFLGVAVSIPLPVWDRNAGRVEERKAAREASVARLRAAKLDMENTLAADLQRVGLLEKRLAAFDSKTIWPVSAALAEMQAGFESGLVDARDVAAMRAQLGELRLGRIGLQAELANALAQLESTTGAHPSIRKNYLAQSPKKETLP